MQADLLSVLQHLHQSVHTTAKDHVNPPLKQSAFDDICNCVCIFGYHERKETTKSIDDIYQEIEQTVSLQSPQRMDDDFISNYYGIDAALLDEYVFSMSEDAADC